ncbi:hypothetical protein SAMN04487990_10482 [Bizionia paragorgiae]|uniref:Uncharacterized protein n=1 Tax=Bizionia paragorgiae TaxID=283786 RepID=A0A1H3X270_BIZPA|nr:hypothetical protein SAMN04487990_10482 [Bizionia paragorgiae]
MSLRVVFEEARGWKLKTGSHSYTMNYYLSLTPSKLRFLSIAMNLVIIVTSIKMGIKRNNAPALWTFTSVQLPQKESAQLIRKNLKTNTSFLHNTNRKLRLQHTPRNISLAHFSSLNFS